MLCCPQRCVENTYRRTTPPDSMAFFLCPFAKVKTLSDFDLMLYLHLVMPGVPDMSKASAQRRAAVPVAVSTTRHFSLGRMSAVNVENLQEFSMSNSLCFNEIQFDVIVRDGQPWVTSRQLAQALGYKDENSVRKIYERNKDEFSSIMTATVNMTVGITEVMVRIFRCAAATCLPCSPALPSPSLSAAGARWSSSSTATVCPLPSL